MSLEPGARLGPYEILGPLGFGGMGEVWRARDTRLDRQVAIKVLPRAITTDPAARAGLEREARAVAALSHPHILSLYDVGDTDGVFYAVTELLEGETLRERLHAGPLPVRKAVEYAIRIAEGLGAAHERGIVHRDLKPENVFLTRDDRLKILDFGLARQITLPGAEADSTSPTSPRGSSPAVLLGTVGYVSPEQVRGQPADPRSDLFALGCVLYEMLSGRRAFRRETAAETMTAILREDPPPLDRADVPPAVDRLLRRCLEKDPGARFQSARDVAFALEALSGFESRPPVLPARAGRRWLRVAGGGVALAAAVAAAGAFLAPSLRRAPEAPAPVFAALTDQPGRERTPRLAPDGRSLLYVSGQAGNLDVYLQRVGGRKPSNLTADSPWHDFDPAWRPDGERIAFASDREGGGIFVMGATGESVNRLAPFGMAPTWSPDGRAIAVATRRVTHAYDVSGESDIWVVTLATGARTKVVTGVALQPAWSPSGARIAYWALSAGGRRDIWTVPPAGGEPVALTADDPADWAPAWSRDGRWVYFTSDRGGTVNVWRIAVEERTGRAAGRPEPVTMPARWAEDLSLSADGTAIAYEGVDARARAMRVAFDAEHARPAGAPAPVVAGSLLVDNVDVSTDGGTIAFTTDSPREDLYVVRADGSGFRQVTDDAARDRGPHWSPDGRRLAFYSDRGGHYDVWIVEADGSGLRPLGGEFAGGVAIFWSPDSRRLSATAQEGELHTWDLDTRALSTTRLPDIEPGLRFSTENASPDGRWLAGWGERADEERPRAFVLDTASRAYRPIPGVPPWTPFAWLPDSRRLLVRGERSIDVFDVVTGTIRPVMDLAPWAMPNSFGFSLSRDGRTLVFVETQLESDVWLRLTGPR